MRGRLDRKKEEEAFENLPQHSATYSLCCCSSCTELKREREREALTHHG